MLNEPVIILVATMGGTATYIAEEMAGALSRNGVKTFVVDMAKAAPEMFDKRKYYIICSATTGQGDIPDNGIAFFEMLTSTRPDLTEIHYGTFALGDMTYAASFCGGGRRFDTIFEELGAHRLIDLWEHDGASSAIADEAAIAWAEKWLAAASATV